MIEPFLLYQLLGELLPHLNNNSFAKVDNYTKERRHPPTREGGEKEGKRLWISNMRIMKS